MRKLVILAAVLAAVLLGVIRADGATFVSVYNVNSGVGGQTEITGYYPDGYTELALEHAVTYCDGGYDHGYTYGTAPVRWSQNGKAVRYANGYLYAHTGGGWVLVASDGTEGFCQ